jgi:hypothetical protein
VQANGYNIINAGNLGGNCVVLNTAPLTSAGPMYICLDTAGDIQFSDKTHTGQLWITQTGDVGIGTASPGHGVDIYRTNVNTFVNLTTNNNGQGWACFVRGTTYGGTGTGAGLTVQGVFSRGTQAAPTSVLAGDILLALEGWGMVAGSGEERDVAIQLVASSNWTTTSGETHIAFWTQPPGSTGLLAEHMRITGPGNVGIGTTTPITELQVVSVNTTTSLRGISSSEFSASTHGGVLDLTKARGTPTAPAAMIAGDFCGSVRFWGYATGGAYQEAFWVACVSTAVGATSVTADFTFNNATSELARITSAGLVGIGTASPGAMLDVNGFIRSVGQADVPTTGSGLELYWDGTTNWINGYNRTAAAFLPLGLRSNPLLLNPGTVGNVGIGTSSPAAQLDVLGVIRSSAAAGVPTTGSGLELNWDSTNANILAFNRTAAAYLPLHVDGSPLALNSGSNANVGIGLANPNAKLDIYSTSASGTLINIVTENNTSFNGSEISGYHYSGSSTAEGLTLNGYCARGTRAAPTQALAGDYIFSLQGYNPIGNAGVGAIALQVSSNWLAGSNYETRIVFETTAPNAIAATEKMRLTGSGNLGIGLLPTYQLQLSIDSAAKPTTNTWTTASDVRLKRNIKPLVGGLPIINQLNPIEAEYNGLAGMPAGVRVVSFDAAEIRKILPHTVNSFRRKLREEDAQETDILDFNIHEVLHHLVLAVQQLSDFVYHHRHMPEQKDQ